MDLMASVFSNSARSPKSFSEIFTDRRSASLAWIQLDNCICDEFQIKASMKQSGVIVIIDAPSSQPHLLLNLLLLLFEMRLPHGLQLDLMFVIEGSVLAAVRMPHEALLCQLPMTVINSPLHQVLWRDFWQCTKFIRRVFCCKPNVFRTTLHDHWVRASGRS